MSSEPPSIGFGRHADRIHMELHILYLRGHIKIFFIVMLFCHEDLCLTFQTLQTQIFIVCKSTCLQVSRIETVYIKTGKFGRSAKFVQRHCLFHILIIGIKNKLAKQKVKILMRRLIRSRLIWIFTVCKCMSKFT